MRVKDVFYIYRRTFARDAKLQSIDPQYILRVTGWESTYMLDYYTAGMRRMDAAVSAFRDFDPFVD